MKPPILPLPLKKGDTIGIIAPSFALPRPEALPEAVDFLTTRGYRVKVGESCYAKHGEYAGPDELRAAQVNGMFADDEVDFILCARGGYGAARLLPYLDYDMIRSNPKGFSGYSDVTALHAALLRYGGFGTYHGLMAVSDMAADRRDPFSLDTFFKMVAGNPKGFLHNPEGFGRETIRGGIAEGPLIGGNLSLVAASMSTPYAYDFRGAILFLEDVGEKTYAIDRMLHQIKAAGVFGQVAGVLLGHFSDCIPVREGAFSLERVLEERLGDLSVPVLSGIRCGHCTPKLTLPLGIACRMDGDGQTMEIL